MSIQGGCAVKKMGYDVGPKPSIFVGSFGDDEDSGWDSKLF